MSVNIVTHPPGQIDLGMRGRGQLPYIDIEISGSGDGDDDLDIEVHLGGGFSVVEPDGRDTTASILELVAESIRACEVVSSDGPFVANDPATPDQKD